MEKQRPTAPRPLVPAALRPWVAALLAVCVAITVLLGVLLAHHTRAGSIDAAADAQIRADLGGHPVLLNRLAGLGDLLPVTAMTAALILACLVTRSRRGAVLVAIAIPVAVALTELVLKPLIGRTLTGALSFPSGHETRVFALAAAFVVLLVGPLRPWTPAAVRLLLAVAVLMMAARGCRWPGGRGCPLLHRHGGRSGGRHRGSAGDSAHPRLASSVTAVAACAPGPPWAGGSWPGHDRQVVAAKGPDAGQRRIETRPDRAEAPGERR